MTEAPVTEVRGFAWSRPDVATPERARSYRTFPAHLAPILIGSGAALAAIGALGAWIRAVELKTEGLAPAQVGVVWGFNEPSGRAIAIFAGVTLVIAAVTSFTDFLPKLAAVGAGALLFGSLLARLLTLNSRADEIATAARANPNFLSFNAGFAWGAWLLMLAMVLVFLGLIVGVLRAIDLRRGLPE
jgi:hypothetical protein